MQDRGARSLTQALQYYGDPRTIGPSLTAAF